MPPPARIEEADFIRGSSKGSPLLSILRAYCLGTLKACGIVNEQIKCQHYHEVGDIGWVRGSRLHRR
jgi:N-alpha-acetyltransferase 35, NatC auxiliary subunit